MEIFNCYKSLRSHIDDFNTELQVFGVTNYFDEMLIRLIKYLIDNNKFTEDKKKELKELKDDFMKYVSDGKYFLKGSGTYKVDKDLMKELDRILN